MKDNERLEFLGDAVLDLAVSHILMDLFREEQEGVLSKCRAAIVNEKVLSQVAKDLRLGDYLLLGKGEELSGGREKPSISTWAKSISDCWCWCHPKAPVELTFRYTHTDQGTARFSRAVFLHQASGAIVANRTHCMH